MNRIPRYKGDVPNPGQMVEINSLSSTNARQMFSKTPLLCTSRSYSSRLNRRTNFSLSRISANE